MGNVAQAMPSAGTPIMTELNPLDFALDVDEPVEVSATVTLAAAVRKSAEREQRVAHLLASQKTQADLIAKLQNDLAVHKKMNADHSAAQQAAIEKLTTDSANLQHGLLLVRSHPPTTTAYTMWTRMLLQHAHACLGWHIAAQSLFAFESTTAGLRS